MRFELNDNDWESLLSSSDAHKVNKRADIFNSRTDPSAVSPLAIVKKVTESEGSAVLTLVKNGDNIEIRMIHDVFHSVSNSLEDWSEDESTGKFYGLAGYPKNGDPAPIVRLPLLILKAREEDEEKTLKAPSIESLLEVSNEEAFLSDDLLEDAEDLDDFYKSPSRAIAPCLALVLMDSTSCNFDTFTKVTSAVQAQHDLKFDADEEATPEKKAEFLHSFSPVAQLLWAGARSQANKLSSLFIPDEEMFTPLESTTETADIFEAGRERDKPHRYREIAKNSAGTDGTAEALAEAIGKAIGSPQRKFLKITEDICELNARLIDRDLSRRDPSDYKRGINRIPFGARTLITRASWKGDYDDEKHRIEPKSPTSDYLAFLEQSEKMSESYLASTFQSKEYKCSMAVTPHITNVLYNGTWTCADTFVPSNFSIFFTAPRSVTGYKQKLTNEEFAQNLRNGSLGPEDIKARNKAIFWAPRSDEQLKKQLKNFITLIKFMCSQQSIYYRAHKNLLIDLEENSEIYEEHFKKDPDFGARFCQIIHTRNRLIQQELANQRDFDRVDFGFIDYEEITRQIHQHQFSVDLWSTIASSQKTQQKDRSSNSAPSGNPQKTNTDHQDDGEKKKAKRKRNKEKRLPNANKDDRLILSPDQFNKFFNKLTSFRKPLPKWVENEEASTVCLMWHYRGYCNQGEDCKHAYSHQKPNDRVANALIAVRKEFFSRFVNE